MALPTPAPVAHAFAPRWSAEDIADAVPLKLHQIVRFDVADVRAVHRTPTGRQWFGSYAPRFHARPFRIKN